MSLNGSNTPQREGPLRAVPGLRDPATARQLAQQGYVRLGPLLSPTEVAAARSVFDDAVTQLDRPLGDRWFPTILFPEEDIRDTISHHLEALLRPGLAQLLDLQALDLLRCDFSVKPPSPQSELGPHQDFSLIDESKATSLYLWIPLEATDERNGTLHVVPGSHHFANRIRSQHVPATFDEVLPQIRAEAVRLDCEPGELVAMVSGVIHFSPANQSDLLRLAAHCIVKPVDAPLVFFYADDETPPGRVECYEVDMQQNVRLIREGRPGPEIAMVAVVDRPPTSMTPDRFRDGMRRLATSASTVHEPHKR